MHSASTRHTLPTNALQHTARITPATRAQDRQQRAAFVQQLDACIRIPSVRLPRTMRRMEMQRRGLRMLYLDDNNRISCCLPCANSACPYDAVCGQCVVLQRLCRRLPRSQPLMLRTHSIAFCVGPTAWTCMHVASRPARARAGIHFAAQRQAGKK